MKKTNKSWINKLAKVLMTIDEVESNDVTESGDTLRVFQLYDGTELIVDEDGYATIDNEQAPAGEHKLSDGSVIVIDENGQFVETKPIDVTIDEPTEATPAPVDEPNKRSHNI